ncbi:MAG TPA: hypothetical protein VKB80_08300 [Kofleriaceae bacterium]|nr:hypothetical protein [Kofleriaceae bacterium]
MSMVRMGCLGQAAALSAALAAAALTGSCGGADRRASESSAASSAGAPGGAGGDDGECCCQRYDEDGNPTGANVSDQTACKSTGGSCTDDQSQCEEE